MSDLRWTDKVYLDNQGNIRSSDGCPTEQMTQDTINKPPKTCIHCLNSEPYVCDIIWCTEWKKPTHRLETCEKFRRMI